jgi:hypothetical protein
MKSNFKLFLLIVFVLGTIFNTSAQSRKAAKDSTTVIIFNSPSGSSNKKNKTGEDNIIKIAPLGLISGTFPIFYERKLTDFLGLQVGFGITSKNYVRAGLQTDFNDTKITYAPTTITDDVSEGIYGFEYRTVKTGTMFTIQPRFYFDSEGLDGSYLGLSFDNYTYNFEIPGVVKNTSSIYQDFSQTGSIKSENEKISDFMVHFGYQNIYDRLTLEWSTAIGIRNVTGTKYAAGFSSTGALIEGTGTYKQNLLNFNIGLKVGYHF